MGSRLAALNLNLLLVLDAVLEERNVTRAARRLHLTQSATSHALAKLRVALNDELLVRTPSGMRPTRLSLRLAPRLRAALSELERILGDTPSFDPQTCTDTFTLALGDYVGAVLGGPLSMQMSTQAPGVRLRFRTLDVSQLVRTLEDDGVELCVGPYLSVPKRIRHEPLYDDPFVCAVSRHHPLPTGRLTAKRYAALRHLQISPSGRGRSSVDEALSGLGMERQIALHVESFTAAPAIVATSDLVLTAPRSLLLNSPLLAALRILPCPVAISPINLVLYYDAQRAAEPRLEWLRAQVVAVARLQTDPLQSAHKF